MSKRAIISQLTVETDGVTLGTTGPSRFWRICKPRLESIEHLQEPRLRWRLGRFHAVKTSVDLGLKLAQRNEVEGDKLVWVRLRSQKPVIGNGLIREVREGLKDMKRKSADAPLHPHLGPTTHHSPPHRCSHPGCSAVFPTHGSSIDPDYT